MPRTSPPNIKYVRGPEEIRALFASIYGSLPVSGEVKGELGYGISDLDVLDRHFPEHTSRLAAGVRSRFLYTSSAHQVFAGADNLLNRESRYLPPEQLGPIGDISINGDTVVFLREANGTIEGCAITHAGVAKQMIGVFNYLWSQARPRS